MKTLIQKSTTDDLLTTEEPEALRRFSSPTNANALETLQVRPRREGVTGSRLHCLYPGLAPLVGYACTATIISGEPPHNPRRVSHGLERGLDDLKRCAELTVALTACCLLMSAVAPGAHGQDYTDVQVASTSSRHEVRYVSGGLAYVEGLVRGQWVGLGWSVGGAGKPKHWKNPLAAFELEIKTDPAQTPATSLSAGWNWQSASELPKTERGARHFVVNLSNQNQPVVLKVHTLLDGTAVLTRWIEITNTSSKPVALTALAPWSGRLWSGDAPITLGHSLRWKYPWEGWFGWTPLAPGANVFNNDRGLAYDDPAFVLRNESNGEYFFGQLAKSPNYAMEFQRGDGLTFRIGPATLNPLRVIAPQETIKAPAAHLGHVKGDFDLAVQAMHDHIRRSVLPTRSPERDHLSEYLIPEDQPETVYHGDDNNETNMKKCMDVAAAAGMEVFILDGPTWASAYGNWTAPDEKRFPRGLAPLVEYAHEKGLLFGLYTETEGGREGKPPKKPAAGVGSWSQSKVFQEHPAWFVQPASVLNLAIPEAAVYMESEVAQIIEHYKLDLYRHDFCSELRGQGSETRREGFIENDYWRHYDAFYGIFDRIHRKFPDLILQQASGGGSRTDLGTVGEFHEQFTSDRATFPYMFRMLAGFSVFLPPETLVNANGMAWPKDLPDLDTTLRGAYTLGNTPMIFNALLPKSVEELKPEVRERWLHYANIYKQFIRPLLPTCKVYHHAPVNATGGVESGDWFAMEFTSPDRSKGWATIIRLAKNDSGAYLFKPKGLDGKKRYRVTFDNTGKTEEMDGSTLAREGLSIQPPQERASELLLFEAR